MLSLAAIHHHLECTESLPNSLTNKMILNLSLDSRSTQAGDVFLAIQGIKTQGQAFIAEAMQKGAIAVYSDQPFTSTSTIPCFFIPHLKEKIPSLASAFYGHPSQNLWITAVTGTNGKSSIAYLLTQAQALLKRSSYYIGTLGQGATPPLSPLSNTTPGLLTLNQIFAKAVAQGTEFMNIEASSHGLEQGRLEGVPIKNAIFTNLTHDHLDYHHSMEAYFQAKMRLFELPTLQHAILNADSSYSQRIKNQLAPNISCLRTSLKNRQADLYAQILHLNHEGMQVKLHILGESAQLALPILAEFQLSNYLMVLANLLTQGFLLKNCLSILPKLPQVIGRMERWRLQNGATVLIDYAHTPDALLQVLKGLKQQYTQVICVFGCGGEKDREKRPKMAKIAEELAHRVIVSSDNPRHEAFTQILADMTPGFQRPQTILVEPDRRQAILLAIQHATPHTVIVLAGKGQETYMEVQGLKHPFDERSVLQEAGATPADHIIEVS